MARLTLRDLARLHADHARITMLTAYDASFARVLDAAGVETLLVGDSLGMVVQGRDSTLAVTLEHIAYHVGCVVRGTQRAFILGDLPFGSYQEGREQAMRSSARLMAAGAQMVKLEGGTTMAETVRFLAGRGVPGYEPRFARNFMQGADGIAGAVARYVAAVKDGSFPGPENCY
jgi:3-methyl-2-oxobutanoate hydroxymethyltransferase